MIFINYSAETDSWKVRHGHDKLLIAHRDTHVYPISEIFNELSRVGPLTRDVDSGLVVLDKDGLFFLLAEILEDLHAWNNWTNGNHFSDSLQRALHEG